MKKTETTSQRNIKPRTIQADLLAAIHKTHPIEAAVCEVLIERGIWTLEG